MRFKAESSTTLSPEVLTSDYSSARAMGKVRLGQECLYYTKFSGTVYLPYGEITRAWLRQEEVNAKLCCGRANFDQFFLMIQDLGGTVHKNPIRTREEGQAILDLLASVHPEIAIGYHKQEAS